MKLFDYPFSLFSQLKLILMRCLFFKCTPRILSVFIYVRFLSTVVKITSLTLKNFPSAQESRQDAELKLVHHLMKHYHQEKQILPVQNRSKPVVVTFDMAFSQLVDLVSNSISLVKLFPFVVVCHIVLLLAA